MTSETFICVAGMLFVLLLYLALGIRCLLSKGWPLRMLGVLVLLPPLLLLAKCSAVNFKHDAEARQLLVNVRRLPLPQGSRLIYEQSEVGGFIAATGDATDIIGYRVFVTDLPDQNVSNFFAPFVKKADTFHVGVRKFDAPPSSPYLYMDSLLKRVPEADRPRAYILYAVDRCAEHELWDARGW